MTSDNDNRYVVISHHQWRQRVIAQHQSEMPFGPENGEPLKFEVCDDVIYTNDFGVQFNRKITGLYKPDPINSLYASGYRYFLDGDAYWIPAKEYSLQSVVIC